MKNLTPEKVHILIFEKANYSKIDGTASSLGEGQIIKTLIEKAHGKKIVRSSKPMKENIATLLEYTDISYNGDMKCDMIDAVMRNQKAIELAIDRGTIEGSLKMRKLFVVSDYPVMSDHAYSIPAETTTKQDPVPKRDPQFVYLHVSSDLNYFTNFKLCLLYLTYKTDSTLI